MIKKSFSKVIGKIREGLQRFWAFHLCMVAVAVLYVLATHDVISSDVTGKVSCGLCWGALAGVFVQLIGEWRGKPRMRLLVGLVTAAISALGCWFWFNIGEVSPHYRLWLMLYSGTCLSLAASSVAVLYRYADEKALVSRMVLNAFGVGGTAVIFIASQMLCLLAFSELVSRFDYKIYVDVGFVSWLFIVPVGFFSLLPGREKDDGTSDRATSFLFWLLLPASLILLGILYVYLVKILIAWSMPSGKLNWFGSIALALYAFFWLALRDSAKPFFRIFVRRGWALLLPVLAVQIIGIVIRYQAYGLSALRFAGMITLSFGVLALILAARNRSPRGLFAYIAVAGLLFTVTPLNIIDVPVWNQEMRLKAALERNGLLVDGEFVPKADVAPSDADVKIIDGAWQYLESDTSTAWHRSTFMDNLRKRVVSLCRERKIIRESLVGLLSGPAAEKSAKAAENRTRIYRRKRPWTSECFLLPKENGMPIGNYSQLRVYNHWEVSCACREGRCYVTVPTFGKHKKVEFDVTEHVHRVLESAGCDGILRRNASPELKPEVSVWPLRPGMALAVEELRISGMIDERFSEMNLSNCALLTNDGEGERKRK